MSVIPWVVLAVMLFAAAIGLAWIAPLFAHENELVDMPILALVFGYVSVTALFTLCLPRMINQPTGNQTGVIVLFIVVTGLVLRLVFWGSPTVLEDDYNRYLWDGSVTASGINPYLYSPEEVAEQLTVTGALQPLRSEAGVIFERINYPEYSTVYPPVAQIIFAISHLISPFDLDGFRGILLVFELATLYFIFLILKTLGRSVLWCAFYWWHPLVIKEVASSAHMEPLLMLPVVVGAFLVLRSRSELASAFLTLGAGVKIWPLLLMPVALKPLLKIPRRILFACTGIALMSAIILLPIVAAGIGEDSGFVAFARLWSASSAAYIVADWLAASLVLNTGFQALEPSVVARAFLTCGVLLTVAVAFFRTTSKGGSALECMFWIIAAIYVLSPSQTPWYFLWVAPFLCFFPVKGLMLAGVLIPLHYLYFHLAARDLEAYYRWGIVWVIWIPVWGVLIREAISAYRAGSDSKGQAHA